MKEPSTPQNKICKDKILFIFIVKGYSYITTYLRFKDSILNKLKKKAQI